MPYLNPSFKENPYFKTIHKLICTVCNKEFSSYRRTAKKCSLKCAHIARQTPNRKAIKIEYDKQRRRKIKIETITHYGGKCACCGESRIEFLAIDHIAGGGTKHRKKLKNIGSTNFYKWLENNEWPTGYRVLCHNCNASYGHYGYCPHENKQ